MHISHNITELKDLAASQWGMFTTAQAQQFGVRRNQVARMVDAGTVEPAGYGVYRLASGNETFSADIKAAWLSVHPKEIARDRLKKQPHDAVVAGRTAAYLHGFGDFYASPYTFAVSRHKTTSRDDMRYLERSVDPQDVVFVDGLPTTSVERTIADLVMSREDPDLIGSYIADACGRGGCILDRERLATLLGPLARRNGYRAHDGAAFAADLIARYAADIQVGMASEALVQAVASSYGKRAGKMFQKRMRKLLAALDSTTCGTAAEGKQTGE